DVVGAGRVIVGHAGLASNINGRVSVRSPGGTALTIDNSLDTASRRVILTSTGLYGVAVADINWVQNDLRALTIRGGNGANTYTVLNTPQSDAPGGVTTTLFGGTAVDTVNILATTGVINIAGGGGRDGVNLGDNGSVSNIRGSMTLSNGGGS